MNGVGGAQGFRHNRAIYGSSTLPDMSAKTLGRYPDIKPSFESVNVEGLYFAGTLAQCRDFRRAGSGKSAMASFSSDAFAQPGLG